MRNLEISKLFHEIADLLEIKDENIFRIRAYRRAAMNIESLTEDIEAVGPFDLLIECSAEASVRAGFGTSPAYVIDTNLGGAIHCFEAARRHGADVVFVSSSRVYSIAALFSQLMAGLNLSAHCEAFEHMLTPPADRSPEPPRVTYSRWMYPHGPPR